MTVKEIRKENTSSVEKVTKLIIWIFINNLSIIGYYPILNTLYVLFLIYFRDRSFPNVRLTPIS